MTTDNRTNEPTEAMELAEVSAAKNAVWSILDDYRDRREPDLIEASDRIVEDLMKRGVLIPEWFADPQTNGKPAQGYYPTASQMEAWEGRKVSAIRVVKTR